MRYYVAQRWTGGKGPVEISEADFQAIRDAKEGVVRAMLIEEKLDLVLDNFVEYEGDLLQLGLRSAVFEEHDWSDLQAARQRVNRRLANLLTTCRLYIDQVPHELTPLNDPALVDAFHKQRSVEYDNRLGYAAMEAVRNYVQHRDLPVSGLSYKTAWVPEHTREWRRHIIAASIDLDKLEADDRVTEKWKKTILPKLRAKGDELNWKVLVREYISGIGAIHGTLRALLAPRVKAWDDRLLRTLREYQAATQASLAIGVEVIATNDEGEVVEEIEVFTGQMDRRKALERKNRNVGHWSKILVTSE
jgi:hypothetical protein